MKETRLFAMVGNGQSGESEKFLVTLTTFNRNCGGDRGKKNQNKRKHRFDILAEPLLDFVTGSQACFQRALDPLRSFGMNRFGEEECSILLTVA